MTVDLPIEDWQKVLAILSQGPWQAVNPLIMAIGEQLRGQGQAQAPEAPQAPRARGNGVDPEAGATERR
jgi:hypothetical protein